LISLLFSFFSALLEGREKNEWQKKNGQNSNKKKERRGTNTKVSNALWSI
jgi:hypothetical protein